MTLSEFLTLAATRLQQAGVDQPRIDARLLIGHALNLDRAQMLSQATRILTQEEIARVTPLLDRRAQREPVARILGTRAFWSLSFGLNEATLEPRPDSEILIETALRLKPDARRILDLGTGSGCLLLSCLHDMREATGLGIDLNPRAVEQAAQNAAALGLASRARFRQGNWGEGLQEKFDLILSNPPYIPAGDIPHLMPEVRAYDPLLALDGGADGLAPYRALIPILKSFLNPKGVILFETGIEQARIVASLLEENDFQSVGTHKDLGGIDRCVSGYSHIS